MKHHNQIDSQLRDQVKELDHVRPPGWDMAESWQKLERMREKRSMSLWRYVEGVAAAVVLLMLCYAYFLKEEEHGAIIAEVSVVAPTQIEDANINDAKEVEIPDTVENIPTQKAKEKEVESILVQNTSAPKVNLAVEIFKKKQEKEPSTSFLEESIPATLSTDTLNVVTQFEEKVNLPPQETERDTVDLNIKAVPRAPVIYFTKPKPKPRLNRKFEVRLQKVNRLVTEKNQRKSKYRYIGGINVRKH